MSRSRRARNAREQWDSALRYAEFRSVELRADSTVLAAARAVVDAALAEDASRLRTAALGLAEAVVSVALDLWCLAAFGPGRVAVPLHNAVAHAGTLVLKGVADPAGADTSTLAERMRGAADVGACLASDCANRASRPFSPQVEPRRPGRVPR